MAAIDAGTEVALRNPIHYQPSTHFDRPRLVGQRSTCTRRPDRRDAHHRRTRTPEKISKGTVGAAKVVADLMRGAWVTLLAKGGRSAHGRPVDYEANLWRPTLRFAFSTGSTTQSGRPGAQRKSRSTGSQRTSSDSELASPTTNPSSNGLKAPGTGNIAPLLAIWDDHPTPQVAAPRARGDSPRRTTSTALVGECPWLAAERR